jgi:hypothetical protein
VNGADVEGTEQGDFEFHRIHSLADLDDYAEILVDDERGAFVGLRLTDNCVMYRDVVGGTRFLQFEDPPTAPEHACILLEHLPDGSVCVDAEVDPGGSYFYYRCPSDVLS